MSNNVYYKELTIEEFKGFHMPFDDFRKDMYVQGGQYSDALRETFGNNILMPISKALRVTEGYTYLSTWSLIKDETGLYLKSSRDLMNAIGFVVCKIPYEKKEISKLRVYITRI